MTFNTSLPFLQFVFLFVVKMRYTLSARPGEISGDLYIFLAQ